MNEDEDYDPEKEVDANDIKRTDVLLGRGNNINSHRGNKHFRKLVKEYQEEYLDCPKALKGHYAWLIVNEIQSLKPPGRFLKQHSKTKVWYEVNHKKALKKTRQALRERVRDIKKKDSNKTLETQNLSEKAPQEDQKMLNPQQQVRQMLNPHQQAQQILNSQQQTQQILNSQQQAQQLLNSQQRAQQLLNSQRHAEQLLPSPQQAQQLLNSQQGQQMMPTPIPVQSLPTLKQTDGCSITSDIFDDEDDNSFEAQRKQISSAQPPRRPSLILGTHDPRNMEELSSLEKITPDENTSSSLFMQDGMAATAQHEILGPLFNQDKSSHIAVKDMANILEKIKKANQTETGQQQSSNKKFSSSATVGSYLDACSISSDIFDDSDDDDERDVARQNASLLANSAKDIVEARPQKRPSITLGTHETEDAEDISLSASIDKIIDVLKNVSTTGNNGDDEEIIPDKSMDSVNMTETLNRSLKRTANNMSNNKKRAEHSTLSDMSISLSSLGTFDVSQSRTLDSFKNLAMKIEREGGLARFDSNRSDFSFENGV